MKYRNLGRSGLKVSTVSFGSWLTVGSSVDLVATRALVRAAIEGGVNLIDTADIYAKGEAEALLGQALSEHPRSALVLASKLFWPMSDDANDRGLSRKHIVESVEKSLQRLETDYLDLYQCHRFDPETPLDETVRAMDDLVRQGKILYWGVSCWTAAEIREACAIARERNAYAPVSNQPPYNIIDRDIEEDVLPASEELGLGQIVFSPLAQGILTGKYANGVKPEGSRAADEGRGRFVREKMTPSSLRGVERLRPVAAELGVSLAQLAIAWCLRLPNVASAIVGATRPEQLKENIPAGDIELGQDALARIEAAWSGRG